MIAALGIVGVITMFGDQEEYSTESLTCKVVDDSGWQDMEGERARHLKVDCTEAFKTRGAKLNHKVAPPVLWVNYGDCYIEQGDK